MSLSSSFGLRPDCWVLEYPAHRLAGTREQGQSGRRIAGICSRLGGPMLRLSQTLRSTHSTDGAVILDVKRGLMFRFNRTGSRILQLLSSGAEEQEIARMLVREFSADAAAAQADASCFLASLREHALIEP